MVITVIVLAIVLAIITTLLVFSVMLNMKLSSFVARFETNYGSAQDILDTTYAELDSVLQKHVILDDPVTVKVLSVLRKCRSEVLRSARLISMQDDEEKENPTSTSND